MQHPTRPSHGHELLLRFSKLAPCADKALRA